MVRLIATGGAITMKIDPVKKAPVPAISGEDLVATVPEIAQVATLGDTLTKPQADGGLNLSRITSSLVMAALMIVLIGVTSLRKRTGPSTEP